MKFLLDVHIGSSIARALLAEGHDVVRAAVDHATSTDAELLALAVREERIVVTQDSDFSDLIYAWGAPPPPAIIYIRCGPDEHPAMGNPRIRPPRSPYGRYPAVKQPLPPATLRECLQ